jgi:two-component system copper resistance phosphate regulon response regulator CusR
MRILVVEDDKKMALNLQRGLDESGFIVDFAIDGPTGLYLAQTGPYDLVVLDLMLPGCDGWTVLKELRRERPELAVLILTARDGVQDRVRGLDLGADDYLVKPFAFSELLARIRAVLRRGSARDVSCWRHGDLEVDAVRRRATRAGRILDLTPKEFLLLALLVRRAGEVLSRSVIAEQVWNLDFCSDSNVVEVHVRRLRAKVDDPFERRLIHTVRGFGYVLEERSTTP